MASSKHAHAAGTGSSPRQKEPSEVLVEAGLRRTPTRIAVLKLLAEAQRAMSHAEVEAALPDSFDRITVYRALDSFVEAGLVQRQVGADRVNRFALFDGVDHEAHSHFHCDDCGNVFCLPQKPPKHASLPEGFEVEGTMLQFHGHCPECKGGAHREASGHKT